jgi:hypothetical protein
MSFSKDFGVPEYRIGFIWNSKAGNLATLDNGVWRTVSGDIRFLAIESRGWYLDGVAIPEWKEGAKSAVIVSGKVDGQLARFTFGGEASREIWVQLIAFVGDCDRHNVAPSEWIINVDKLERKANRQSWFVPAIRWERAQAPE